MTPGHRICPAFGCSARIGGDQLFCTHHWLKIPRSDRARLLRAFAREDPEPLASQLRSLRTATAHLAAIEWPRRPPRLPFELGSPGASGAP